MVNTGDDDEFHGLWVCPDLDSVTYTLADAHNHTDHEHDHTDHGEDPTCIPVSTTSR